MTHDTEQMLDLARSVVSTVAPDELPSFEIVAAAVRDDPEIISEPVSKKRREPIGFGAQLAGVLVTPIALRAVGVAYQFLRDRLALPADEDQTPDPSRRIPSALRDDLRNRILEVAGELPDREKHLMADSIVSGLAE